MSKYDEIQAREQAASPGPWKCVFNEITQQCEIHDARAINIVTARYNAVHISETNTDFITNAREDIPYLLGELKEEISHRFQTECNYDHAVDDRDRWQKRAEALVRAIQTSSLTTDQNSICALCTRHGHCWSDCAGYDSFEFDEEQFTGGAVK